MISFILIKIFIKFVECKFNKKMRIIPSDELIINADGSVFHLHLRPGELSDKIILVGDPARADKIGNLFEPIELCRTNREFRSYTGIYNGKRLSVISTGIGCDNIDIVINEIDALFNVDFESRIIKDNLTALTLLRLGTSGAVQSDISIGDYVMSEYSIGIDGLLNFYDGIEKVSDADFEHAFINSIGWSERMARPYVVKNDEHLAELFRGFAIGGVTITAGGFYAPQGRVVRLPLTQGDMLQRIENFRYASRRITNFEMESSAIAGLAALMGHKALTVCAIIAQRRASDANTDYQEIIDKLIEKALQCLTK